MEAQISEFLQALRAYANRSEAQLKMEAQYSENLQALAAIIKGKPEVEVDSNSRQEVGDPTPSPPLLVQATQGAFQEVAPAISLDDAPISPAGGVAVLQPHGVTAPEVLGITPSPAAVAKKVPVVVHMTSAAAEEVLKDVPDGSLDHISMAPITCSTKSLNQLGPSPPSSTTEATPPWVFTSAAPSLTAKGTVLRSTPWPSLIGVPADGDETRPMPWPSFAYYHQGMLLLQSRLQPHGIYLEPSKCEPHVSSFCSAISDDLPVNCSCAENFDQRQAALICCDGKCLCLDTVYNAKSGEYVSLSIGIKAMDHRYCSCLSGKSLTQNSVGPLSYALIDAPCSEYSSQALAAYISFEDTVVNRNYPEAIQFSLSLLSSAQCQWLIPWFVDGFESATIVPCISYWRYWTCFIPCLSYGAEDSELASTSLPTRLSHTGEFGCKTSKEWYKFGNVNGNSGFRMHDTVRFFPDSKNWLSELSACLVLIAVELHYSNQATASENLFGNGQRLDKLSTETFRSCGIQLLQFEQYVSQGLLFCAIQVMQSLQPKPPWLYSAPSSITVRCQYKSILEGINSATGTEHQVIYSVFTPTSGHDSVQGTRNFLKVSQKMNGEAALLDQFAVGYPFFSDMARSQWENVWPFGRLSSYVMLLICDGFWQDWVISWWFDCLHQCGSALVQWEIAWTILITVMYPIAVVVSHPYDGDGSACYIWEKITELISETALEPTASHASAVARRRIVLHSYQLVNFSCMKHGCADSVTLRQGPKQANNDEGQRQAKALKSAAWGQAAFEGGRNVMDRPVLRHLMHLQLSCS